MKNIIFQYYPAAIDQPLPIGIINLERFIETVGNPSEKTRLIFGQIKAAAEAGDLKLKAELKAQLYAFTPCAFVKENRAYVSIINWTGLLALDFDKLEIAYCIEFKQYLFDTYPFIIATWLSASKHGVRAFVKIPICHSVGEFKEYFNAIKKQFSDYNGFDASLINCILPMYLSYDPDILFRTDYTTWNRRFVPIVQPVIKQYIINDKTSLVEAITKSAIDKITDAGHPILRAASYALGGYVGAGYLDKETALTIIENLIDSSSYLSQKASNYKRTAKEMINKGEMAPLYLRH